MNRPPSRKEEASLLGRFTGFLKGAGQEEAGDREPAVIFRDPVAEVPRGTPPPPGPGTIIPLRMGKGCAGGPATPPPQQKEEEGPPPE